ncbi:MAG: tRNA(Ile)-lysidine synthetase [Pseudolabrys sp.]|jgi:tRNA(Ile)-lysidine synthase|nr:tRNA(Ile)-lysidine synthetase [Pseudolabrys sp.]
MTTRAAPVSAAEAKALFGDLAAAPAVLLAVSGGPDSTALLWLAARWRKALKSGPALIAVTVDHGLRKEAKREAAAVAKLAKALGVPHRTMNWTGAKPKFGIQQAARHARYRLLAAAAKKAGASHIVTAHTLDDQAETVLMRMARGSGLAGLSAMAKRSRLGGLILARPFLDIPKARLVATVVKAKLAYAEDPSNADPKYTRARLRRLMAGLAEEGLDARRLSLLARRLRRADAAIDAEVTRTAAALLTEAEGRITIPAAEFGRLPAEVGLRLLGRAMARMGDEGPVELGKLEALYAAALPYAQKPAKAQFRRTLAGGLLTIAGGELTVETAPTRRTRQSLTKRRPVEPKGAAKRAKTR